MSLTLALVEYEVSVDVVLVVKLSSLVSSNVTAVFLLKSYLTQRKKTLFAALRGRVELNSIVHTDGWRAYDGLVDVGYEKHLRVHHGENEFALGDNHINGIESFWGYAKHRLAKIKGIPKHTFYLHLKETEFRFNNRKGNLYKTLLKLLREQPV